ncbi:MAG: hypothetical protein NZ869_04190 [Thermoanaerobaculum sp.]|nr:hypothetical protein [Thermoanaerobaculum sp.]MDW7966720.1 hypothetical protein [Thermoanaerobaculum sp.]
MWSPRSCLNSSRRQNNLLGFVLLWLVSFCHNWLLGVNRADEVWFFTVAKMVSEGALPYRDFAFPVLPTSLYLAAVFLTLVGKQLLAFKAFVAGITAGLAWLASQVFCQLGGPRGRRWWFLLTCLVLAPSLPGSPYGVLAYLFLVAGLSATLKGLREPGSWPWILAGLFAGLGFTAKHNLGLLALLAVLVAQRQGKPGVRWRHRIAVLGAFGLPVLLSLVPVFLSASWDQFYQGVFGTKAVYARTAFTVPLQGRLTGVPPSVVFTPAEDFLRLALRGLAFASVGFAVGSLLWLWRRKSEGRREPMVLGLFLAVAVATAFPRFDSEHVLPIVPLALVPLTLRAEAQAWRFLRLWHVAAAALLAASWLLALVSLRQGVWRPSQLPSLQGVRLSLAETRHVEETLAFLGALPREESVLFIGPYAAFYYTVSQRKAPTRYLLPLVTCLGDNGQRDLLTTLERVPIRWLCWQTGRWPLRPQLLEQLVTTHWQLVATTGECHWYRRPPPS